MNNLKHCRFYFGDDPTYEGFTDGTTWNGFDNIWVTPEVHKQVMADHPIEDPDNNYWDIEPDDDGLISYAYGFATSIDEDDWHIRNQ